MGYSSAVTQILRMHRYVTSTSALLDRARDDFRSADGPTRLGRLLDISPLQAEAIILGDSSDGLNRLAFHYGYMPSTEDQDAWRMLPMNEQPFGMGPTMRWDAATVQYVYDVLTIRGEMRPSARELAWRMDTTERRLRDALRRRNLRLSKATRQRPRI